MAGLAHLTRPLRVGKNKLVHDDVVCVDAALGQLLDQALCLIQGEELSNTHTDEGGLLLMDERTTGQKLEGSHTSISVYLTASTSQHITSMLLNCAG